MPTQQPSADDNARSERREERMDTPVIPDIVYDLLPEILKKGTRQFKSYRERDIFLLGSVSLISGALPNVYGYYDRRKLWANLYMMVIAPPASGKGVLNFSRNYVTKIEEVFRQIHRDAMSTYRASKPKDSNGDVGKPTQKRLIIPANSSSAGFMRKLSNTGGAGIIFETEADTLSNTLKNDWGNYSDILRNAFQHENVSSSRVDDDRDMEIIEPRLSALISGTLDQVSAMKLDNPMNGLQSRFLFYLFDNLPFFKDVSPYATGRSTFDFKDLGEEFFAIYTYLSLSEYEFVLTKRQWTRFHNWFDCKMRDTVKDYNMYATGTITRLGTSAFRILMILSTLRSFEQGVPDYPIVCTNKDLIACHFLMETLFSHSFSVFSQSLHSKRDDIMAKYLSFWELLPGEFTRKLAIDLGSKLFTERSIDRRLAKLVKNGLLHTPASGKYIKLRK